MLVRRRFVAILAIVATSGLYGPLASAQGLVFLNARREFSSQGRQPESLAAEDFDRDGRTDLIVANARSSTLVPSHIRVFKGKGDGTFEERQLIATGGDPIDIAVGD